MTILNFHYQKGLLLMKKWSFKNYLIYQQTDFNVYDFIIQKIY